MTSDNTTINSTNFNVDKDGNMTCNNGIFNGGNIRLSGDNTTPKFEIVHNTDANVYSRVFPQTIFSRNNGNSIAISSALGYGMLAINSSDISTVAISGKLSDPRITLQTSEGISTIITPQSIKVNDKPCILNHGGVETIGFVYIADGTASEYGYLEIATTDKGIVGVNCWQSDKRLKENIQETDVNALDIISKIKHRKFNWKNSNTVEEIGYIAQELEEIKKNFVIKIPQRDEKGNIIDERYQINETKIIPYLTKAIQEQQEQIENQNNLIQSLIERIEKLEGGAK